MHIGGQQRQEAKLYSLDQAIHESRYVYGVVAATIAVQTAMEVSQTEQTQADARFKQIMGTDRFGKQTISELQRHMALTELDKAGEMRIITMDAYRRQLGFLGKIAVMREQQAQQDWARGDDDGLDVLLEDTSHLLPMPGVAALTQFGIDYLGESPERTRSEADLPYMQHTLPSDPT